MLERKQASKQDQQLKYVINLLKAHPQVRGIFEHFGVDVETIHEIPIDFKKMDVSAKTKDCKIFLNDKFVEDGDIIEELHYIIHELVHWLQQTTGAADDYGDLSAYNYLDMPTEIEAFREQIKFISDYKSKEEANKYLDNLLDFHQLKGKERENKRQQLGA